MNERNAMERKLTAHEQRLGNLEERAGSRSAGFVPVRLYNFSTLTTDPARLITILVPGRVYHFPVVPRLADLVWIEGGVRQGPGRISLSGWDVTVAGDPIDDTTTEVIADLTYNAASPGVSPTPHLDSDEDEEQPRRRPAWRDELWAEEETS